MSSKGLITALGLLVIASMILTACGSTPVTPAAINRCSIEELSFKEIRSNHLAACWLVE